MPSETLGFKTLVRAITKANESTHNCDYHVADDASNPGKLCAIIMAPVHASPAGEIVLQLSLCTQAWA